ncbi:DDE-type integrase/transposase/recombinase [Roseibium sp. MB-4]
MKLWLTAQEIADLKLELFPATKRGIQKLADREDWASSCLARKREGREGGGGMEYHIDLLPLAQRLEYAGTFVRVEREDYETETTNELNRRELSTRDARLILLKVADRFRKTSGLGASGSDHLFCQLFEDGKVPLPEWVLEHVKKISTRTMHRWRSDARTDQNRLAYDPANARKGTGVLDRAEGGAVRTYCLALYAENQFLSAEHIRNAAIAKYGPSVLVATAKGQTRKAMPPLRTFQNALKGWKHEHRNELLRMTNPDKYKSTVRMVATGGQRVDRLNEVWEIDASPSDVMTKDGRRNLYLCIDLYSRRVKILVSETPRAAAVGLMIRKSLLAWGVPEILKTDNGSDFKARATTRLLDNLGIEVDVSAAYSPEQKGTVERVIGTFQRDCSATLPGFIGHSVSDRKVIESRKAFHARLGLQEDVLFSVDLTAAELQEHADWWTDQKYAFRAHSGLKGKSPMQVAAAWTDPVRAAPTEETLRVLLAPAIGKDGIRTVTKNGVRIKGEFYLSFDVMPDTQVFCRQNPDDLGRIWLFEPDGETYLGEAVCPDLAGLDPVETIAKVRARQNAIYREFAKPIQQARREVTPRTIMEAEKRATQHNADIVSFPGRQEGHTTPAIEAAKTVSRKPSPRPLSTAEETVKAKFSNPMADRTAAPEPLNTLDTPERRWLRACQLEDRIKDGQQLSEKDAHWLTGYQSGGEYRARKLMEEHSNQANQL